MAEEGNTGIPPSGETAAETGPGHGKENVRLPPQSIMSEQGLIGGLLADNSYFDIVSDIVSAEDFYRSEHRLIYGAIEKLASAGRGADRITVYGELDLSGRANEAGGMQYLADLSSLNPGAVNMRRYAEIVRDRSLQRQVISAGGEIASIAKSEAGTDVAAALDMAQSLIFAVSEKSVKARQGFRGIGELSGEIRSETDELRKRSGSGITGIPSGFADLDRMTDGLQRGDLVIVAGRPSMGKTALALNMAEHVAVRLGLPAAVFSMEMSSSQIARRLISSNGRIDAQKLRQGRLVGDEWTVYTETVARLGEVPLYIDDTPGLTVTEVRTRARRLVQKSGRLALVVVDYLQLMSGSRKQGVNENRATEIGEISRGLKALAREMDVPVVALSQLNRQVESRPDRRPLMSDLRESGSIEQDADLILFVYRGCVYDKSRPEGEAEVIIGKQRNGPTGVVPLTFLGQYTRFENSAGDFPV